MKQCLCSRQSFGIRRVIKRSKKHCSDSISLNHFLSVSPCCMEPDCKNRCQNRPVRINGQDQQNECKRNPPLTYHHLILDHQDHEADKQCKYHIQLRKIKCHHIGNLGDSCKDQKSLAIFSPGMCIVKTFHKEIAHGNGCEVADINQYFPEYRVFR